jgi:hypothetical protein
MPEVDGYELIRLVRKLPEHVPAIAVSAHSRPQDRAKALVSRFDGYCRSRPTIFLRWCRRSSPIKSDWRIALEFTDEVPDHDWQKL